MIEDALYTVKQAADLTGYSEKAIRRRIENAKLHVHQGRPHTRILVSTNDLRAAGLLEVPRTLEDRAIERLVKFLKTRPGLVFSTWELRTQAGLAQRFAERTEHPSTGEIIPPKVGRPSYTPLSRQKCETALSTLRALGLVEKTTAPSGAGTGRPRNGWRWIGRD